MVRLSTSQHNKMPSRLNTQDGIRYLSEFFGGRTSDRISVTRSKFPDFINPGDQVLADRSYQMLQMTQLMLSESLVESSTDTRRKSSAAYL